MPSKNDLENIMKGFLTTTQNADAITEKIDKFDDIKIGFFASEKDKQRQRTNGKLGKTTCNIFHR